METLAQRCDSTTPSRHVGPVTIAEASNLSIAMVMHEPPVPLGHAAARWYYVLLIRTGGTRLSRAGVCPRNQARGNSGSQGSVSRSPLSSSFVPSYPAFGAFSKIGHGSTAVFVHFQLGIAYRPVP